ncbi:MAG: S9 family peptidase [Pseudomonadota bacterium]
MNTDSHSKLSPPVATKQPIHASHHGFEKTDNYAWLKAENWQNVMQDPTVLDAGIRTYLEDENAYMTSCLAHTEELQEVLFDEMKGRIKEDDSSVPTPDGTYAYYVSYQTGSQYPRFCRHPRDGGDETILLDVNTLAEGQSYFQIGGAIHSPDHKYYAYASDNKGSEYYTVEVLDLETGNLLQDKIENTNGNIVWAEDNKTLFYTKLDSNHRPKWVYRHTLNTPASEDVLVYEEQDSGFFIRIGKTQSNRFIIINANDHQTSEARLIDAHNPESEMQLISAREHGHEYSIEHHGGGGFYDRLIILTNKDDAEDFKIMETPLSALDKKNWSDIEYHRPGRLIIDAAVLKQYLIRIERENGLPRIVIRNWIDGEEHAIAFDEQAYSLGLSVGYEYDTETIRFSYSSMTTPSQVYDYNIETKERVLRKTQEVPSGHNADDYVTRRLYAKSHDNEDIPVSLLYKKDTPLDGTAPVLLYGYGSYGIAIPASFSTTCLSLVNRGFIYAIAHIRGGKDKGYRWYREGRGPKKINTFKDFISVGEHLAEEGLTSRGNIVAQGGSAGGMLMGAVANMAPDLFRGILAEVPFVDVLNTMLDDTLPLTPPEWPEWGNPIESKEAYETIVSYSPYDNVEAKAYPNILAIGGLTDPRVTYWEPAKWVAKLREYKTDENLLLLKTNMEAGHGGASGRFDRLKEVALNYAFALHVAGKIALNTET